MDAQRVPRHQFRSDRQGAQAPWATSLKYRGNTLRIHPPFHHSIGSSGAVFSNGQSGVNYPTEKTPADAIGWGIKALTSHSSLRLESGCSATVPNPDFVLSHSNSDGQDCRFGREVA